MSAFKDYTDRLLADAETLNLSREAMTVAEAAECGIDIDPAASTEVWEQRIALAVYDESLLTMRYRRYVRRIRELLDDALEANIHGAHNVTAERIDHALASIQKLIDEDRTDRLARDEQTAEDYLAGYSAAISDVAGV